MLGMITVQENQEFMATFPSPPVSSDRLSLVPRQIVSQGTPITGYVPPAGLSTGEMLLAPSVFLGAIPPVSNPSILEQIRSKQWFAVDRRRRNGLIIVKQFHAEFAGPGAAVGGLFDHDAAYVIPVGDFLMVSPNNYRDRQEAFLIRRQWIKLTNQVTDESVPVRRAQMMLTQFDNYFERAVVDQVPDEAFALLVGVFPHTVRLARLAGLK